MNTLQVRNEAVINAPVEKIWRLITDISMLHKVNPGIVKASGRMDAQGETRTCEVNNNGRKGMMVENLIEMVPEKKTVWSIERDTMGMSKMLADTRFIFNLEKVSDTKTKVVNETYYRPRNFLARIMNGLMMKRMISRAQTQILSNIRILTEDKLP